MILIAVIVAPAWSAAKAEEPTVEPFGRDWIVVENQPGQLWNLNPNPGVTVTWSGACVDGKASGRGREVWSNGDVYEGGVQAGKIHGHGTVTSANGDAVTCEWRNNGLVDGICDNH